VDLRALEPIYSKLPEVAPPDKPLTLKQKLMWVGFALVSFFVLSYIHPFGYNAAAASQTIEFFQVVLASNIGSVLTAGIGPIVVASIILQLFVGSGLLKADLSTPEGRRAFMGTQKLLAIVFSIFEGFVFTGSYVRALPGMEWLVALQIAFGSIILMYLDELVMKWGIGSGISLFIAANVSRAMIWRGFGYSPFHAGYFFQLINSVLAGNMLNIVTSALPFITTIIVFLLVVYAEGIHVDIPITWARARGFGGRYPIRLLYLSNIPVILAAALFANIQLWAFLAKDTPLAPFLGTYKLQGGRWVITGGLAYYTKPPYDLVTKLVASLFGQTYPSLWFDILHAIIYAILLTITSVAFGYLWLELSGMGPKQIAEQLVRSGFSLPGFRRDPRIVEQILEKYIPVVAILGSAFAGILAAFTDIFGALASGMGILLAVTIVYRFYELLMRERMLEQYPALAKVLG